MHKRKAMIVDMLQAGVSGYILKDNIAEFLPAAINAAMNDELYLCPEVNRMVAEDYSTVTSSSFRGNAFPELTGREREVLELLVEEYNTKQAAQHLGLSVKTIEATRSRIMKKLNIFTLVGLTKYAIREGITTDSI